MANCSAARPSGTARLASVRCPPRGRPSRLGARVQPPRRRAPPRRSEAAPRPAAPQNPPLQADPRRERSRLRGGVRATFALPIAAPPRAAEWQIVSGPRNLLRAPDLLIQISPDRIEVENLRTGATTSRSPVVRVSRDGGSHEFSDGEPEVVPHDADRSGRVVNGFGHPRVLVSDFFAAAFALKQTVADVVDFDFQLLWFRQVGRVVVQSLRQFEGGLTQAEVQAVLDLGKVLDPKSVTVYQGVEPLSAAEAQKVLDAPKGDPSPVKVLGDR